MKRPGQESLTQRIVEVFLTGNLSIMLILVALLAGAVALLITPREEEPQIVVPMADVYVRVPGASAEEVERQVATRLEKLLSQIDGVEYVYSMSRPGLAIVTVRFYVGQNREDSLVKIYNKVQSNTDFIPPTVDGWVVKPVEIDDVPIVNVTLYSDRYDDAELRRFAEEMEIKLQSVKNTNKTFVLGGRPRLVRVELDSARLAAHSLSPLEVARSLQVSNVQLPAGHFEQHNEEFVLDAGTFLEGVDAVRNLVVGVHGGRPVHLHDVADVEDGPAEVAHYTWMGFGPAARDVPDALRARATASGTFYPAVHVAVAKKRGTNAVRVARAVERKVEAVRGDVLPDGVYIRTTRDYGETADAKVNELVRELLIALLIVVGLLLVAMGWREAAIVAVAVPITFSLTLLLNYFFGYTINRVTLFAMILSLGLVVDDPIVDVENIYRHFKMRKEKPLRAVLTAVNEVRPPIILATLAVIISFVPMFFISGMMGPYMGPMALNVPLAMFMSLGVAFTITPWMAYHILKREYGKSDEAPWVLEKSFIYRVYRAILPPFFKSRLLSWGLILVMVGLFGLAGWLAMARYVPLKMLPFDNKNEFQIVIDMPESQTLEQADATARALANYLRTVPEVTDFQTYAGTASPMDFNGLVRHYYMREGANVADIRVNLVKKEDRVHQSHELVLRLRKDLEAIARRFNANIKIVELPPGPPVIATVTAEVYGQPYHRYADLIGAAKIVRERLDREAFVVDRDTSVEDDQVKLVFATDKEKAALNGVSTEEIVRTLRLALDGLNAGTLRVPDEVNPLAIEIRLPRGNRSGLEELRRLYVKSAAGALVAIAELGSFAETIEDKTIYHKNLERVVYVFAEMAGRAPAEAILDVQADRVHDAANEFVVPASAGPEKFVVPASAGKTPAEAGTTNINPDAGANEFVVPASAGKTPAKAGTTNSMGRPLHARTYLSPGAGIPWHLGEEFRVRWTGEGEWQVTVDVFRDLGIAFGAACLGIYLLLIFQTGSYFMPLILMISIPLTMIGIMPGFWLLNVIGNKPIGGFENPVFFTATAMIGMIALSGIAVRNAILLIEFVHEALKRGDGLEAALLHSGAVRTRPIILTAGAAMLGAWPITLDPIFSGLAWALIFGLLVSTAFTLILIPIVYWMVYHHRPGHGVKSQTADLDELAAPEHVPAEGPRIEPANEFVVPASAGLKSPAEAGTTNIAVVGKADLQTG
jgi:multidrug efflux pump subunit AcrB